MAAESAPATALQHYSAALAGLLADDAVTEVCFQEPGIALVERAGTWSRIHTPWATLGWASHFARLVATATEQRIGLQTPLLSAALPTGERVQVVLPPATAPGCVAIAIRRPSRSRWTLDDLERKALFEGCRTTRDAGATTAKALAEAYRRRDWRRFLALAVTGRLNVVVSGATGSGKTTLTKAMIQAIPADERLVSIEDAAELDFQGRDNVVRLYYSKDGQGTARVSAKQLLEASLRLRPDRILLAELRGEEAYYFLRNVSSGHPGSITSVHAGSARLAFEQLALLIKESGPGRDLGLDDIHRLLRHVVDVVVQCTNDRGTRRVSEVWWREAEVAPVQAATGVPAGRGSRTGSEANTAIDASATSAIQTER